MINIKSILFISIFISFSCKSDDTGVVDNNNIIYVEESYSISSGGSFKHFIGNFPTEGSISIFEQAMYFEVSEIKVGESGVEYEYKARDGFVGNDYVEILYQTSIGNNNLNQKTIVRISITIGSK